MGARWKKKQTFLNQEDVAWKWKTQVHFNYVGEQNGRKKSRQDYFQQAWE